MGSVMSYSLGPQPATARAPAGILAFSRLHPHRRGLAAQTWPTAPACRVFIAHGRRDPIMDVEFARRARRR